MAATEKNQSQEQTRLPALGEIVGNQRLRDLLAAAIRDHRLFPALLFHGPDGVGKRTTALAVAAALNCDSTPGDACGTCGACRKIAAHSHPDVKILESEPAARKAGRPVFYPAPGGSGRAPSRLVVGQVRALVRDAAFRPFEAKKRVFLVRELDSDPSQACANALLKLLEEPPRDAVFVLLTSRPDRLPETIRSRCQSLAFQPASTDEVVSFLQGHGIEEGEARLRAALADRRPGQALALDAEGGIALRDGVLEALSAATSGPLEAIEAAELLAGPKTEIGRLLSTLTLLARDLMIQPHRPGALVNIDRADALGALSAAIPAPVAAELLRRLEWCERASERHVNSTLMLQTLMLVAGGHVPLDPLDAPWLPGEEAGTAT